MPTTREQQHTEWKESWHPDYFKTVCGFANAQGGRLYVGQDDQGQLTGLNPADCRRLLETLPNQARDLLGIVVEVNHHATQGRDYLELVVEPYPYPISYRGRYYYRSGSTTQELRGAALDAFLLQKQGRHWDGVPVPGVAATNLSVAALDLFRERASQSGRVNAEVLFEGPDVLLDNLHLTDGPYLKRAAVLLFHPQPERFVAGAYVKLGYFATDDDLRYQDEVHGPLLLQVEHTLALLRDKYLPPAITYQDGARVEQPTYPEAALREALLNALAHKDYSGGTPIQLRVYATHVLFWNEGQLPERWTVENLQRQHPSKPFNPDLANTLFRAGYIESWGRGTLSMLAECHAHQLPSPRFTFDVTGCTVQFFADPAADFRSQGLREELIQLLLLAQRQGTLTNKTAQQLLGISKATATRYLRELVEQRYLRRSGTTGVGTSYSPIGSPRAHDS